MNVTTIVFLVKEGTLFLARKKRGFGAGYLNGYGGKQQPTDATIEDTAIRELFEESGVRGESHDLAKMALIDFFEGDEHWFECHIYFLDRWEGVPKESEEMDQAVLYDCAELPFESMWYSDRAWMALVFAGQKIRGRFFYKKGMNVQERFEYEPLEG